MITETLWVPTPILCAFVRRAHKFEFLLTISDEDEDDDELEIEVEFERSELPKFRRLEDMVDRYNEENDGKTSEDEDEADEDE